MMNIGGELERAIAWKNKKDTEKMCHFLNKAREWMGLTMADLKNHGRIGEIVVVQEEYEDFSGENHWKNTDETMMKYWNSFFSARI
ncbi:MAG: hypothetical protein IJ600_09105 [Lachnospiraceae bacterium]|nr:hypothetical protein [Lachnospiraceae bacterium]